LNPFSEKLLISLSSQFWMQNSILIERSSSRGVPSKIKQEGNNDFLDCASVEHLE